MCTDIISPLRLPHKAIQTLSPSCLSTLYVVVGCSGVCYTEYCCVCVHLSPLSTNTEPSLTLHNLNIALDTLPDEEWDDFGIKLNVPYSQRNEIKSQYISDGERKSALLHTYLTSHPAPSWQHVAEALYRCYDGKFHTVLGRVQRMFPTGKGIYMYMYSYCRMESKPSLVSQCTNYLCV